jgi:hypothetical protein
MMQRRGGGKSVRGRGRGQERTEDRKLTPRHLLRQLEPSLFFKGQTTSLLASETEKELVREARGGMAGRSHGGAISDSQCRARVGDAERCMRLYRGKIEGEGDKEGKVEKGERREKEEEAREGKGREREEVEERDTERERLLAESGGELSYYRMPSALSTLLLSTLSTPPDYSTLPLLSRYSLSLLAYPPPAFSSQPIRYYRADSSSATAVAS